MKIQFYIQSDTAKDKRGKIKDRVPVYIRFNDGRKFDLRTKTGLVIDPRLWEGERWKPGKPKSNVRDAADKAAVSAVTATLKRIDTELTDRYNRRSKDTVIDANWLKQFLFPNETRAEIPSQLVPYFEYYQQARGADLGKASVVKLNVIKHLLERYQKEQRKEILIQDVNGDFKTEFFAYSQREGYAPNTTARNFKFIKTVCYHAQTKGIDLHPELRSIRVRPTPVEKIYLSNADLDLIRKKKLPHDYLDNARDWLLISCETGQRVSDLLRFEKAMIRYSDGVPLLEFTQVKTREQMTIPLSSEVMKLLKKRKGEFPRKISDQRYNEYIKEVCKLAGITYKVKGSKINPETNRKEGGVYPKWELVSSHIGRRSLATNNYGKIPTPLLMLMTGHTTEAAFLQYIGRTKEDKALELARHFAMRK